MPLDLHNQYVAGRIDARPKVDRFISRDDGEYERVVSLRVVTDDEMGAVCFSVSIEEIGDGLGGPPWRMGVYPITEMPQALDDSARVASWYSLRLRVATVRAGWRYYPWAGARTSVAGLDLLTPNPAPGPILTALTAEQENHVASSF